MRRFVSTKNECVANTRRLCLHYGTPATVALVHPTQHTLPCWFIKVCEKVESKGTTSYNEVADELVAELKDGGMDDGICYDEKNIRRRVYDAINVLMALDIIAKEKKAIIWKGFPTTRSAAQQVRATGSWRSCGCCSCLFVDT